MSKRKNDIAAHLRLDQIKAYNSGKLSHEEMHQVERHLLTCQLCADAVEGFEESGGAFVSTDVEALRDQLKERIAKPERAVGGNVKIYRIAAAIAFLLVATVAILNIDKLTGDSLTQEAMSMEDAEMTEEIAAVDSADNQEATLASTPVEDAKPEEENEAVDEKRDQGLISQNTEQTLASTGGETTAGLESEVLADEAKKETDERADDLLALEAAPEEEEQEAADDEEVAFDFDANIALNDSVTSDDQNSAGDRFFAESEDKAKSVTKEEARERSSEVTALRKAVQNRVVNGRITSADNQPLTGVNVVSKEVNLSTITDANGVYNLELPVDAQNLEFSFVGFIDQQAQIPTSNQLNIKLQENAQQLSEVVVLGYSQENYDANRNSDAAPVGGNNRFKEYVENNLQYPLQAIDNKISGRVVLEFTVSATGSLSGFRVLRGLGYGCDEEAIRLVREGPTWTPASSGGTAVEEKVRLRIKFDLPQ